MLKQIYTAIVAQIKSKASDFTDADLVPVAHFDLYFSQYQQADMQEEHPFAIPAVFVEMDFDFANQGQNTQKANLNIRLHLVQECYADTADNSIDKALALKILDTVDMLHTTMQGFDIPQYSGKFVRTRLVSETNPSNLYTYILEYQTNIDDNSTHRLKDYALSAGNHGIDMLDATLNSDFNARLIQKRKPNAPPIGDYSID